MLNTGKVLRECDSCQHEAGTRFFLHMSVCERRGSSRILFIVDAEDMANAACVAHKCLHPFTCTDEVSSMTAEGCTASFTNWCLCYQCILWIIEANDIWQGCRKGCY